MAPYRNPLPSAVESYLFLATSVVFAVYVRLARLPKVLYLLPVWIALVTIAITVTSQRLLFRLFGSNENINELEAVARQIQILKEPEYLAIALVASVLGLILAIWVLLTAAEVLGRPRSVVGIHEKRSRTLKTP